ncbi:CmpA/NrtA family ABC transporter substrate-binding protein [Methylocella silvestris]|nr:CmpA/NrtA family ABC transporter substrate-binding protein [Methylocella silvestris]
MSRSATDAAPMAARGAGPARMRIGFLQLTDAAPLIVAQEFGYFAEEGIDAELAPEPSWANIADKLAYGFLDAAVIVPPLAFAVELGLRGVPQPLIVPNAISLGGNTITLAGDVAAAVRAIIRRDRRSTADALAVWLRAQSAPAPPFGVVHAYSTHNLLMRYWLATAGVDIGREASLAVVPPALAVEALRSRQIVGFCAGAPWGEIAARAGVGVTIATSRDIWQNAPEKAFAIRERWIDQRPDALGGAIRALVRAAQFCDAPENASYTASLLSRRKYLNVDSHAILPSLPGGGIARDNLSSFYGNAATFPWRSHALWFLREMTRWGLIETGLDLPALAARVYRPDLYRSAVKPLEIPTPLVDAKEEGAHAAPWLLDAAPAPIAMSADLFCDGAIFDPAP